MSQSSFQPLPFIKRLSSINHRQGKQETKAAELIMSVLDEYGVKYIKQYYQTRIPNFISATLTVDGKKIPAIPTSFVSGEITSNYSMISSLISSQRFITDSNINFNPRAKSISRSNHYFAPAIAVAPKYLKQICDAKKVHAVVKVEPEKHRSLNMLVGNTENPKNIVFAHYDSIGPGAIDDASGIALLLQSIIEKPKTLEQTLYVISGNEELSYDKPLYWGYGYRVFEKKYSQQLQKAKQIICVDCIGHAKPEIFTDPGIVRLGLPLANLAKWQKKTAMLSGDIDALMEVYHSDDDTFEKIDPKQYVAAYKTFQKMIV